MKIINMNDVYLKEYSIDGKNIATLEDFYHEVSNNILPNIQWGKNLDALNDILRGGFGTPKEGFIIIWKNSNLSKINLGYEETARILKQRMETCHPSNTSIVEEEFNNAVNKIGDTVYDWLIKIIKDHGPNGSQKESNVILKLK